MSNKVFCHDIEKLTLKNNNYRNVKYTHPNKLQLVLMSLKPLYFFRFFLVVTWKQFVLNKST